MGALRTVAGIFGNVFAAILILAPTGTMYQIWRDNGVGHRWVLNYAATFANAVCMVAYTLPSKRYLLGIVNAVAVFAEFVYSCFYRHYAEGRARRIANWAVVGELSWGAVVLVGYFSAFFGGRNEELRNKLFGVLSAVTSAAMYATMLFDSWAVYRTHATQNQNPILLLAALGGCISWTIFANKPRDLYIEVPNGAGMALTIFQTGVWVIIWVKYRNAAPVQQGAPPQNINDQAGIELPPVQQGAPQQNNNNQDIPPAQQGAPQQNNNNQAVIDLPPAVA